jgi:hypothetical protein
MSDFLSLEYAVNANLGRLNSLTGGLAAGVRDTMQTVLDALVANIRGKFSDSELASTVISYISDAGGQTGDQFIVEGHVISTWGNMIWYELGRLPGGKMPPIDAMLAYINKHGIKPDPQKTVVSFAHAVNYNRVNKRGLHALPLDVLVNWAQDKPVDISQEFALKSLAFAMAKKIQRDGVPGKHHFEQGLAETRPFIQASFEHVVISTTGIGNARS